MVSAAGGVGDWEDAFREILDDYERTTKTCRHGNHVIHLTSRGTWEDGDGLEVCVKAAATAMRGDYVTHEPLPEQP